MGSGSLRLILLGLGILLVVGIYLWDRYKVSSRRSERIRLARKLEEPHFDSPEDNDVGEVAVRATSKPTVEVPPDQPAADSVPVPEPVLLTEKFVASLGQVQDPPRWEPEPEPEGSQIALDFEEFNAHGDSDYLSIDPDLLAEIPRIIVQISVMSAGEPFTDDAIRKAMSDVEMKYGDMEIYHRHTRSGQILFSMASVVEPGTFPKKSGGGFSTPGVVLFTQLPGVREGLAIYNEMLAIAERLATLLNARLHDEAHNKLTKQGIEHTRQTILEHQRQIQLLRSRH